ncbi:Protein aubergine, partial [Orchesella cincta]
GGGKRRREGDERERERDSSKTRKSEGDRRRESGREGRRERSRDERRESGREERRESGREERGRERGSGRTAIIREDKRESYQSVHAPVARKVELLEVTQGSKGELLEVDQGSKGELASGYKGMDCKVMTMGYERAWALDTNTSKGVMPEGGKCERAEAAGKRGARSVGGGRSGRVLDRETRQKYAKEGFDLVNSRGRAEDGLPLGKKGVQGNSQAIKLQANFFKVESRPNWRLFHYYVGFTPEEPEFDTWLKKALFRKHSVALGANIFDGSSLYTPNAISQDALILKSTRESDRKEFTLTIKLVGELAPTDVTYLQLYNIFVRRALEMMKLEEMGRNFYDHTKAIRINAHHLELWPGFKTVMRNYEQDILLQVEITYKVLRLDNCLQVIKNMTNQHNEYDKERIRNALVGTVVMTIYNRKTYKVDDIDWETTPTSSFDKKKGEMIKYLDYFKSRYGKDIQDTRQPLLVSRPTKKDLHRGFAGKILLIPELCQRTGLTDEMRANNQLMRALATHLHPDPETRVGKLTDFMRKMKTTPEVVKDFRRWGLQFNSRLVEVDGRIIPNEAIVFANDTIEMPNDRYDWNNAFRTKPMLSSVPLKTWVVITTSSSAWCVDKLVNNMQRVSRPLNFLIATPTAVRRITGERPSDFAKAVDDVMNEYKGRVQLLFVILPRQALDTYAAVKKRTIVEFGDPDGCRVRRSSLRKTEGVECGGIGCYHIRHLWKIL